MNSYDPIGADRNNSSYVFLGLAVFAQLLGAGAVILVGIWLGKYWGGFSWTDPHTMFNYHPLFMVLGLVFLYGDAILVYRVFRSYRKFPIKVLHAVLHILAFLFSVVGIKMAFDSHNVNGIPNMYSLHSWLGIVAIVLFGVQWLFGLFTFLIPQTPQRVRGAYLPVHVSFGSMLYLFILGVAVAGITEKNIFAGRYSTLQAGQAFGNVIGLFIVAFGGIIFYLITHPAYRRIEEIPLEQRALRE